MEATIKSAGLETLRIGIGERVISERETTVAKVYRTGDLSQPLTVSLTSSDDDEVDFPSSVTIPAGREWELFFVDGVLDAELDGTEIVEFVATAPGFAPATNTLDVVGVPFTPPTISSIADVTTIEDQVTNAIPFSVSDADGSVSALTVSAVSTNTTLIPTNRIVVTGTARQRSLVVTPALNQHGTATIDLIVTDGDGYSATTSFNVTVTPDNDLPTISNITDKTTSEDTPTNAIAFTIGDIETAAGSLKLAANSTNTALVPVNNVTFGGSGTSRTVTILPALNQFGVSTITLTVTDGDGGEVAESFVLTVNAAADSPMISNLDDRTIDEDGSTGPIAFTVGDADTVASDLTLQVDSSNTTLVPLANIVLGGADANRQLTVTPEENLFGAATITITVTDELGLAMSSAFELTVRSINDPPTVASSILDQSATEDQLFLFAFDATTFVDIDPGDMLSYSAVLTDDKTLPGWLSFESATRMFSGTPENFDVGSFHIRVIATDQANATTSSDFTLTIANTNDAPTAITLSSLSVEEDERGAVIGNVSVTDVDTGDSHTFAISDDRFEVVNGQLRLKPDKMLDHESEPTIELDITATDVGSLSKSVSFVLTVTDINEFAPTLDHLTLSVDENAANGTLAGTLQATDADTSQTVRFELIGASAFSIHPVSGEIRIADATQLDHEAAEQLLISVKLTDNGTPPKSTTTDIVMVVNDLNEFTPQIAASTFTVVEGVPSGTSVGAVSGTDQDRRQRLSYRITGASIANAFTIITDTGALIVGDATLLDHESRTEVSLIIEVQDSGTPPRSSTTVITVEIEDANEFSPAVEDQTFAIDENASAGVSVGLVRAHDQDRFQMLRYALLATTIGDAFTLDSATGEITVSTTQLDHEVTAQYQLLIEVTDDILPIHSSRATITIDVRDANEFAPELPDQGFAIRENSSNGAFVGTVFATDADTSQDLSYAITTGNADGAFAIDEATGELTVADDSQLDHEVNPRRSLRVKVVDSGSPSRSATGTILVSVLDVNETPQIAVSLAEQTIEANVLFNFGFPSNSFVDPDAGDVLHYTGQLTDGSPLPSWISFDPLLRQFSGAASDAHVGKLDISVVASDSASPSLTTTQSFQFTIAANPFPWHDTVEPLDVNRDGSIAPVDVLIVINELNSPTTARIGGKLPLPYDPLAYPFDVNADGFVTPVDALIVINFLNRPATLAFAEAEFVFLSGKASAQRMKPQLSRQFVEARGAIRSLALSQQRFSAFSNSVNGASNPATYRSKIGHGIEDSLLEELAFDVAIATSIGSGLCLSPLIA